MLTIRLQRTGKKNHALFRVVLAEKTAHVSKKFKEVLGSYNPHKKALTVGNPERIKYWIDQNIHLSPTVHNLLVTSGILKDDKVKSFNIPKKPEAPKEETKAETVEAPAAEATTETPAEQAPEAPVETPTETPAA